MTGEAQTREISTSSGWLLDTVPLCNILLSVQNFEEI